MLDLLCDEPQVSQPAFKVVETRADTDFPAYTQPRATWKSLALARIEEWDSDPSIFEEDDTPHPSSRTVQIALRLADWMDKLGAPVPTRIVPDVYGGIVFELDAADRFVSLHVHPDEDLEYRLFDKSRLVQHEHFKLPAQLRVG